MNATVSSEPHKFSAGVLALVVHLAFFALLYFGVSWHSDPPQGMVVDIWDSLPDVKPAPAKPVEPPPPAPAPVEPKPVPAPEPPAPAPRKIDIDLGEKKKPKVQAVKPAEPKPVTKPIVEQTQAAPSEQEKARQAQIAAEGKVVDDYKSRIIAKVRRYIVMPPSVDDGARAEFDVTLLPGGTVLSAKKTRPSGNAAYDDAVERAIWKAQPLPLPADVAMFNRFRELHLIFTPKD